MRWTREHSRASVQQKGFYKLQGVFLFAFGLFFLIMLKIHLCFSNPPVHFSSIYTLVGGQHHHDHSSMNTYGRCVFDFYCHSFTAPCGWHKGTLQESSWEVQDARLLDCILLLISSTIRYFWQSLKEQSRFFRWFNSDRKSFQRRYWYISPSHPLVSVISL